MLPTNPGPHPGLDAQPLPAFTLGTALAWTGHDCRACPAQASDQMARMWLIAPPPGQAPVGMRTFVDVEFLDPAWSPGEGVALMEAVNACTVRDRILVVERSAADRLAIGVVSRWLSPASREMQPTGSGRFAVLDQGRIIAADVAYEAAHEFVHAGCVLCAAGTRHGSGTVRLAGDAASTS